MKNNDNVIMNLIRTIVSDVSDGVNEINKLDEQIKMKQNVNKTNNKSFIFIVGPDGIIDISDGLNPEENKVVICHKCGGDGYLSCEKCGGDGYIISKSRIGEKNVIDECTFCNGHGEIICPICNGCGEINNETNNDTPIEVDKQSLNESIKSLFLDQNHKTIIGLVKINILNIIHKKNVITIVPDVNYKSLLNDENITIELDKISKQFNSPPIIIHNEFYF